MAVDTDEQYPLLLDDGAAALAAATDAASNSSLRPVVCTPLKREPRPASKARINPRFLQNMVRDVEGHNAALLRRERDERLSWKKHPLVDKIRAIEMEKLERVKQTRRRSRSPGRRLSPRAPGTHHDTHDREAGRSSDIYQVRGRGSRSAQILNSAGAQIAAVTADDDSLDDWMSSREAHAAQKAHKKSIELQETGATEQAGREWDGGKGAD